MTTPEAPIIEEWYALLGEVDDAIVRGGWRIDEVGTEEVFDKHRHAIEESLAAIRAESSAEIERLQAALDAPTLHECPNCGALLRAKRAALAPADAAGREDEKWLKEVRLRSDVQRTMEAEDEA